LLAVSHTLTAEKRQSRLWLIAVLFFILAQWQTVPESRCTFPYYHGGQVYCYCRHIYSDDPKCGADYYTCPVAENQTAFCIPTTASLINGRFIRLTDLNKHLAKLVVFVGPQN
jgi:hypothetical protein